MNSNFNLLVIAHPDDETIFFSGLLQTLKPWHVICVTDGNADGQGHKRTKQFEKALNLQKVSSFEQWDFLDIYHKRLSIPKLVERLKGYRPQSVFTHGIVGEYGHPHHQDVSMAVHKTFKDVSSVAYNCYPDLTLKLTQKQFELKAKILSKIYFSETERFANFLPATSIESFAKLSFKEVESIYLHFTKKKPLKNLDKYEWFKPYLAKKTISKRPF